MHHPIVPLLAMTLVVAGCVTPPEGHGRYFHMYKGGTIALEVDGLTNAGCRAFTNEFMRDEEVSKVGLPEGTVLTCTSDTAPRSVLPVKYTWSHVSDERTFVMWASSMAVCQFIASNALKANSKAKTSCEVEKY